jgi:DNA-binding transcriptional LysR family regulator
MHTGVNVSMSNITIKQLEVLTAIVEWGNFTEAAKHLFLSQSTVSSHLNSLESALRVTLFHRESKKHVTPTEDGRRLYYYAKDVLRKCSSIEELFPGGEGRELLIGASSAPAKGLLPKYLTRFAELYPDNRCDIRCGDSGHVQQMVAEGDVQIGLVGCNDGWQALFYEPIAEDHLILITAALPRFQEMKESNLLGRQLLACEPLICREGGSGTQKTVNEYLSEYGALQEPPRPRYYVSDPTLLQEMVAAGLGVAIVSALSVQDQIKSGRLLCFELEPYPTIRTIYLITRKHTPLGQAAEDFLSMLRQDSK